MLPSYYTYNKTANPCNAPQTIITPILVSTEGALGRPMANDDHPIHSTPIRPLKPLNELNRPQLTPRRLPTN